MKNMAHAAMFNANCAAKFFLRNTNVINIKTTPALPVNTKTLLQIK